MKFYLNYNIWNKESHIDILLRCIKYFIPPTVIIDFTFEDLKDSSLINFNNSNNTQKYLINHQYTATETSLKYRMKNINAAIERFLKTDCDVFIAPQDDQFIQDSRLLDNIRNLYSQENNIGLVGMRDGFEYGYKNYFSSNFSISIPSYNTTWLKSGDYKCVDIVNDGPLVLHRKTIEKVGLFDAENFNVFYIEDDYCLRCKKLGLRNFVLGGEILHMKFGSVLRSELYYPHLNFAAIDRSVLRRKHNV